MDKCILGNKKGKARRMEKDVTGINEVIPMELIMEVMGFCEFKTLVCSCTVVSRSWRDLANQDLLWHRLCERR